MDTIQIVLIFGAILAVAVGFWLWRRGQAPKQEAYYHFRCPGCGRRLRFRERQAGNKGQCSHCGKALTFPPISQAID